MIVSLVFWLFLIGALAIGWQAGGSADRRVILAIAATAALTGVANGLLDYPGSRVIVTLLDLGLLFIVARHALVSNRYWPVWFAGAQATMVILSLGALLIPTGQRSLLVFASSFWAFPALTAMLVGLLADQKSDLMQAPSDPSVR